MVDHASGPPRRPDDERPENGAAPDTDPPERSAGSSAAAEAERLAALSARYAEDAKKWARGADGELRTAERLDALGPGFVVLHDLHVPGSDANVDHLVVGPAGVFVVDSKAYAGPLTENRGTLWSGQHPVRREVDTVEFIGGRVSSFLGVPVRTVLCFTDAPLPRPRVELGATVAVGLGTVQAAVSGPDKVLSAAAVERLGRRAAELREPVDPPLVDLDELGGRPTTERRPKPSRRPRPAPTAARRSAPRTTGNRARGGRHPQPSAKGLVLRLVVLVVGLVFVLPAMLRGCRGSGSVLPGAPTTTAAAAGPAVTLQFNCPGPGQGYTGTFVWPAGQPMAWVEVKVSAGGAKLTGFYWTDLAKPPKPLTGIAAGASVDVATKVVARPFQDPAVQVATAPATPC